MHDELFFRVCQCISASSIAEVNQQFLKTRLTVEAQTTQE